MSKFHSFFQSPIDFFNSFKTSKSDFKLYIPFYQRNYQWGTQQIDALFCSIEKHAQSEMIFFGSVIYKKTFDYDDIFSILDGQQRITTFILLYSCLCNFIKNNGLKDKINIQNIDLKFLKGKFVTDSFNAHGADQINAIIPNTNIGDFDKTNRYVSNYYYLYQKIENEYNDLEKINKLIIGLEKIKINFIIFEGISNSEELNIFANVNTGGMKLGKLDVLQTFLHNYVYDIKSWDVAKIQDLLKETFNLKILHGIATPAAKKRNGTYIEEVYDFVLNSDKKINFLGLTFDSFAIASDELIEKILGKKIINKDKHSIIDFKYLIYCIQKCVFKAQEFYVNYKKCPIQICFFSMSSFFQNMNKDLVRWIIKLLCQIFALKYISMEQASGGAKKKVEEISYKLFISSNEEEVINVIETISIDDCSNGVWHTESAYNAIKKEVFGDINIKKANVKEMIEENKVIILNKIKSKNIF